MEYYNFENQLFKVIEVKSVQPVEGGHYIIRNMKANNISTGRSSEIFFERIITNSKTDDSVFSLQNLER
jgi:hypothetical protein